MLANIIFFILGSNLSLVLYTCILVGARADKEVMQYENSQNNSKEK